MTDVRIVSAGPIVVTPAQEYLAAEAEWSRGYFEGRLYGIREGERRMLWAIAVGAECDYVRFADARRMTTARVDEYFFHGHCEQLTGVCAKALRALRDLGDEDASRVLGERGW